MFYFHTGKINCEAAIKKITSCYDNLTSMPMKSMLPQLQTKKVITLKQKERIAAKELQSEGAQIFLDDVLILSLRLDLTEIYNNFIEVLKNSGDQIQCRLAELISTKGNLFNMGMLFSNWIEHYMTYTLNDNNSLTLSTTLLNSDYYGLGLVNYVYIYTFR